MSLLLIHCIYMAMLCMQDRGLKFQSCARNYECNLERMSNSSQSTRPEGQVYRTSAFERITRWSRITHNSLMIFIANAFKGHVHVFAGQVEVVCHSSCRTSAIFKYICQGSRVRSRPGPILSWRLIMK